MDEIGNTYFFGLPDDVVTREVRKLAYRHFMYQYIKQKDTYDNKQILHREIHEYYRNHLY